MTRFRKLLVGLAIAAAVTVPVGIAYAADSGGSSNHVPMSGMMSGDMDPADCPHASQHQAHMNRRGMMDGQGMQIGAMHAQISSDHMGTGGMCAAGSSTRGG